MFDMTSIYCRPNHLRYRNETERAFFTGMREPETNFFRTDIRQTDSGYLLEAELPGFKKEEIAVDIEGRTLTITAKKEESSEQKDETEGYLRRERRSGTYSRSFRLNGIVTEDVTAAYEDGILRIDLPKKEMPVPEKRHLTVN